MRLLFYMGRAGSGRPDPILSCPHQTGSPGRGRGEPGNHFGFTESACGLASVIINFVALGLYAKVAVGAMGGVAGLKAVIISYGAVGLLATVALIFLLPNPEKRDHLPMEAKRQSFL